VQIIKELAHEARPLTCEALEMCDSNGWPSSHSQYMCFFSIYCTLLATRRLHFADEVRRGSTWGTTRRHRSLREGRWGACWVPPGTSSWTASSPRGSRGWKVPPYASTSASRIAPTSLMSLGSSTRTPERHAPRMPHLGPILKNSLRIEDETD
jgi:hypothetical protein